MSDVASAVLEIVEGMNKILPDTLIFEVVLLLVVVGVLLLRGKGNRIEQVFREFGVVYLMIGVIVIVFGLYIGASLRTSILLGLNILSLLGLSPLIKSLTD